MPFRRTLPYLLILLIAFGLRVWHLNTESIWHDEGWSIHAIHDPINTPDDKTPFGYYGLMHFLWLGAGDSPFALRYGSALLGVLVVALGMMLAVRWYNRPIGLTAGILLTLSPLLWEYAQEVRAYSAIPLFALALLAVASYQLPVASQDKAVSRQKNSYLIPRSSLLLFLPQIGVLYTHNLGVPLVAWVTMVLGLAYVVRWDWRNLSRFAALQIAVGVCYIPWVLTQAPSGTPINTPPTFNLGLLRDVLYGYLLPALPQLRDAGIIPLLDVLWVLAGVGIVLVVISRQSPVASQDKAVSLQPSAFRKTHTWLLISQAVLLPILTTILLIAAHIDFHPRYYIASLPATLILIATIGPHSLTVPEPLFRKLAFGFMAMLGAVVLFGVYVISMLSIKIITMTPAYEHDDFANLAKYYATLPEDTAILLPFQTEPALQNYYAPLLNIRARFVNVPLYSDESTTLTVINQLVQDGIKNVEFLTWYQLPADERGMYPCLLTAASQSINGQHTFVGLMTESYTLTKTVDLQSLDLQPRYADYQLVDAAYDTAPAGICLRTAWNGQPSQPSVAARLLNPFGAELDSSDAAVKPSDPTHNADWSAPWAAYNRLSLPLAAPQADYGLTLTLYSADQPQGFDLLDTAGNPAGKIYTSPSPIQADGVPYSGDPITQAQLINSSTDTLQTGLPLDITLLLPGRAESAGKIELIGNSWRVEQSLNYQDTTTLAWLRFIVPPGNSGAADLVIDGHTLATYTVSDPIRTFEQPNVDYPVNVDFPGVGTLIGANISGGDVTLIWQATGMPTTDYTVFVQVLDANNSVVAQHDRQPADANRPTTTWVDGEYITDLHPLPIAEIPPDTCLIVGLYDAGQPNFPRLKVADGETFAVVPTTICH